MKTSVQVTKYVIQFEPRLSGWIAFKVVTESKGAKTHTVERAALTTPKPAPRFAARALARVLKGTGNET